MKLDDTDKCLLQILQEDSQTNVKEIAAQLNLTKSPIYDRIRRFEREGIIKKHVAVIDSSKIESSMIVFCSVSLDSQKLNAIDAFRKAVKKLPEIIECYLMGGANDFLLKVIVKDFQAYHVFSSGKLAALPNISQIKSTFVINEVKRSTVIPIF